MSFPKYEFPARYLSEYCCKCDESLTLVGDISGLTHLMGYTADEISATYQNSLAAMTDPDAKSKLLKMLSEADEIECILPVCHKKGHTVWVLNKAIRIRDDDGTVYVQGILVDITKLKQAYDREKRITHVWEEEAKKDSLTHIYNAQNTRKLAEAYLNEPNTSNAALLIIDLDDFKQINDKHGHMFGDAVLVQTAKMIKKLFRSEDIVGRIGGEEFLVLMKGTADLNIIQNRCDKLNESMQRMFGGQIPVCAPSCSIGVALFPQHANSYFDLFCCADRALYYAKANGKRQHVFYDERNHQMNTSGYSPCCVDYDEKTLRGYICAD